MSRRRAAIVAGLVVVSSALVGTVAALAGGSPSARVVSSAPDPTTESRSTTDATSTTIADSTTTTASIAPTTVLPPPTPATAATNDSTTTVLVCHDSYDPRCGPLTFTSTPVNAPLTLAVDSSLSNGTVTLHIRAADDAAVDPCMQVSWGDGVTVRGPSRFGCTAEGTCAIFRERYGPWDPPAPTPESITVDFSHAYEKAGDVTISILADSAVPCSPDQFYASTATKKLQFTITAPASTTTVS